MFEPAASGDAVPDLLRQVGDRVRGRREAAGVSRAELARRSGLSMRFLAALEAGKANISILRLQEVAEALGLSLPAVVGAPDPPMPPAGADSPDPAAGADPPLGARLDVQRLRAGVEDLVRSCSEAELLELHGWLAPRVAPRNGRRIALLGLRGAGKSHVGRLLAEALGVPFLELDRLVEEAAGLPLEQIFELQGAAGYRKLERRALSRFLATTPEAVLATGGGLVTQAETYGLLRRSCTTVWLKARPEDHWNRVVAQGDRRPMRGNPAAMRELRDLLAEREPLYARASYRVETSGRDVQAVTREILERLQRDGGGQVPG